MVSGYHRDDKMSLNMYNDLVFKKKSMRIDWRKIAAVDLDRIVRDMDVFALQDNIDHLTFCNIDVELDTRIVDPTYIKLFKMSQYTIEYLMHSQNYLTEVISSIEGQLNKSLLETDHYKSSHDKIQKELIDLKKENKKRKKMIETQQGLMNANSSNYHQCAYCSKVFLNISYLQAHVTRRHSDVEQSINNKQNNGIEKELLQIKERLKNTENDLVQERTARLSSMSNLIMPTKTSTNESSHQNDELLKQMESIKRQKDDFKKTNDRFKSELRELTNKNNEFEREIKDLQEKLSKKSNVGWMKDDIELQKDSALKQKQEIERLNILLEDYEKQIEELKTKWKTKEATIKKKHLKELNEKEDEIQALKAQLLELQNSVGKTDNELVSRLEQMQINLQQEQKLRYNLELELGEIRNRPPPVTPRQNSDLNRSISPAKPLEKPQPPERPEKPENKQEKPTQRSQLKNIVADTLVTAATLPTNDEIYLVDYCPFTLKAVQKNPDILRKFKVEAHKVYEDELDQLGIDSADKTLTKNDYKQKSNSLKVIRKETSKELPLFDEMRQIVSDICDRHASQRLNVSMKSTGNRVTFKPDLISRDNQLKNNHHQTQNQKPSASKQVNNENSLRSVDNSRTFPESEETDDDVSLSNALESNDDDTEPTKSLITETINSVKSPRRGKKTSTSYNQDEISDLESISQLLTDRSGSRRKALSDKNKSPSKVEENRKKIEAQLAKSGSKPSPNAVPVGFQSTASRLHNQDTLKNASFSSISDLDNETNKQRPKSGLKSTLSESSSIWVSDTHDSEMPNNHNKNHDTERPPTANSLKTSNFDSDEDTNIN